MVVKRKSPKSRLALICQPNVVGRSMVQGKNDGSQISVSCSKMSSIKKTVFSYNRSEVGTGTFCLITGANIAGTMCLLNAAPIRCSMITASVECHFFFKFHFVRRNNKAIYISNLYGAAIDQLVNLDVRSNLTEQFFLASLAK